MCDHCGCSPSGETKIENFEEFKARVNEVVETELRPYIKMDGGDIEIVDITETGVIHARLQGACSTCPHAAMTLKMGVERVLKENVPGVCEVVAVED